LKEGKRAERRFQKEKMKKRARSIYKNNPEGMAEKLADHIANCSCPMCRNPRTNKFYKGKERLTLQERKEIEKEIETEDFRDRQEN
jgi:hypothetical protein